MLELIALNPIDFYTALTSQPHWSLGLVRPNRTRVEDATELGRVCQGSLRQEGRGRANDLCRDDSGEESDNGSGRYRSESDEESDYGSDPNRHEMNGDSDDGGEPGA